MVPNGDACIDRYEAHVEELSEEGAVVRVHPPNKPAGKAKLRAVSARGVLPQAHFSQLDASAACAAAGKRLCSKQEWLSACMGREQTAFPYGTRRRTGACNDAAVEPLSVVFARPASSETWGFDTMNDPRLQLVPGGVARTGRFDRCSSENGAQDMVGNLHEWTAEPGGTMRGGFYLDTSSLGEGCRYETTGHNEHYRDYSTGFRCCVTVR